MRQTGRKGRTANPPGIWFQGLRLIVNLDVADLTRGLASMANPDGGNLLDMLGRSRAERVEKMATILRNSSDADIEEMGIIFGLAMAKVADAQSISGDDPGQGRPGAGRSTRDPVTMWIQGMRRIGSLDPDHIRRGLQNLINPSVGGLLDALGPTRNERVEKLAAMLRNGSQADADGMGEMGRIYALAVARVAEDQTLRSQGREAPRGRADRPRRRRGQSSAEWRKERRLAS